MIKQELVNNNKYIIWDTIIRLVKAENEKEAIGKYVLSTYDIICVKKLEIICTTACSVFTIAYSQINNYFRRTLKNHLWNYTSIQPTSKRLKKDLNWVF